MSSPWAWALSDYACDLQGPFVLTPYLTGFPATLAVGHCVSLCGGCSPYPVCIPCRPKVKCEPVLRGRASNRNSGGGRRVPGPLSTTSESALESLGLSALVFWGGDGGSGWALKPKVEKLTQYGSIPQACLLPKLVCGRWLLRVIFCWSNPPSLHPQP